MSPQIHALLRWKLVAESAVAKIGHRNWRTTKPAKWLPSVAGTEDQQLVRRDRFTDLGVVCSVCGNRGFSIQASIAALTRDPVEKDRRNYADNHEDRDPQRATLSTSNHGVFSGQVTIDNLFGTRV
nr:hypothetical protein [Pararhizobium sp. IMCC21322]